MRVRQARQGARTTLAVVTRHAIGALPGFGIVCSAALRASVVSAKPFAAIDPGFFQAPFHSGSGAPGGLLRTRLCGYARFYQFGKPQNPRRELRMGKLAPTFLLKR